MHHSVCQWLPVGYGQNPQAVCDAPRWHVLADYRIGVESGFAADVLNTYAPKAMPL